MSYKKLRDLCFISILSIVLFYSSAALALASHPPDVNGNSPSDNPPSKISRESVDFLTKTGRAMAEVAEAVLPSVVNISTIKTEKIADRSFNPYYDDPLFRRFFGDRFRGQQAPRERKSRSLGSGVIVSSEGYILTNTHVVKNADKIKVVLADKREFVGKIIGNDQKTELSVIKIDAENLSPIDVGNSDDLRVGELVFAIGNPFGLRQTITMGIVSAVGRANVGIAEYEDFIQTDVAINPGNSGGALVNVRGELVGINTAIFSTTGGSQGIGFSIPSNMAKVVMSSLIETGKVIRGWLGVSVQPITPELARQFQLEKDFGTLVAEVIEGSPAEEAGLMRGDVIVEFNGRQVDEPYHLRNIVAGTLPGETIEMKVIRDGDVETLMVTIGELPSESQETPTVHKSALMGVSVQNLSPEIYRQLNLPEKIRGVVITDIESGSPAETSLVPGDVILEINRNAIKDVDTYEEIVSKLKPEQDLLLLVYRRGSTIFITINMK